MGNIKHIVRSVDVYITTDGKEFQGKNSKKAASEYQEAIDVNNKKEQVIAIVLKLLKTGDSRNKGQWSEGEQSVYKVLATCFNTRSRYMTATATPLSAADILVGILNFVDENKDAAEIIFGEINKYIKGESPQ